MFELLESVKKWFASAPVERKLADMMASGGTDNDRFKARVSGESFESGVNYFGVRLSGLHMKNAREFLTQQLPLFVCLAEFMNGGQRRTIPFSIGPDAIRQKMKAAGVDDSAKPAWVELRDLTVVRPTPVNDTNLYMYTGLFSVPGDDLVKTLLNVVGTVGTALGQPSIGPGLKAAETVYDSFGSLLGFNKVRQVVAALIGNALTDAGSGYLLIGNVGSDVFDPRTGRVVDGRLCWPANVNGGRPVVEFDHALLALERFETVIEKGTGLAAALFDEPWAAFRKTTNRKSADEALDKLRDTISASPDLTEADRLALLLGYTTHAEDLIAARWPTKAGEAGRTRAGGAPDSVVGRLAKAAVDLERAYPGTGIRERIDNLALALNDRQQDAVPVDSTQPVEQDEDIILGAAAAIRSSLLNNDGLKTAAVDARIVAHAIMPEQAID